VMIGNPPFAKMDSQFLVGSHMESEFYEIYHGFLILWDQETGFPFGRNNLWVPSWFLQVYIWTVIVSLSARTLPGFWEHQSLNNSSVQLLDVFFPLVGKWE
jgi:hypothetical protein